MGVGTIGPTLWCAHLVSWATYGCRIGGIALAKFTRRAALTALGALAAGGVLGLREVRRVLPGPGFTDVRLSNGCNFMGTDTADMGRYMEMFDRHRETSRVVEEIPGGVRTTTESNSPELAAQLQAHVSDMYVRLDQGIEVR